MKEGSEAGNEDGKTRNQGGRVSRKWTRTACGTELRQREAQNSEAREQAQQARPVAACSHHIELQFTSSNAGEENLDKAVKLCVEAARREQQQVVTCVVLKEAD